MIVRGIKTQDSYIRLRVCLNVEHHRKKMKIVSNRRCHCYLKIGVHVYIHCVSIQHVPDVWSSARRSRDAKLPLALAFARERERQGIVNFSCEREWQSCPGMIYETYVFLYLDSSTEV